MPREVAACTPAGAQGIGWRQCRLVSRERRAMVDMVKAEPNDWPYDGTIGPSRTATLDIDMQHDFCGQGGYVDRMGNDVGLTSRAIAPIKAVLRSVRRIPGF